MGWLIPLQLPNESDDVTYSKLLTYIVMLYRSMCRSAWSRGAPNQPKVNEGPEYTFDACDLVGVP